MCLGRKGRYTLPQEEALEGPEKLRNQVLHAVVTSMNVTLADSDEKTTATSIALTFSSSSEMTNCLLQIVVLHTPVFPPRWIRSVEHETVPTAFRFDTCENDLSDVHILMVLAMLTSE